MLALRLTISLTVCVLVCLFFYNLWHVVSFLTRLPKFFECLGRRDKWCMRVSKEKKFLSSSRHHRHTLQLTGWQRRLGGAAVRLADSAGLYQTAETEKEFSTAALLLIQAPLLLLPASPPFITHYRLLA